MNQKACSNRLGRKHNLKTISARFFPPGKPQALRFKAGTGRVIRGWDHALLTMCKGERSELQIEVRLMVDGGEQRREYRPWHTFPQCTNAIS